MGEKEPSSSKMPNPDHQHGESTVGPETQTDTQEENKAVP